MIRRRDFLTLVGSTAAGWTFAVRAQQPTLPEIVYLSSTSSGPYEPFVAAFQQGLKETGFVVGQNVTIEYRWAEGQFDRLPALAADLVGRQVAVIAAGLPQFVRDQQALFSKKAALLLPSHTREM